jgi:glycosyltransferase involved in cell wall biosynthesis
MLADKTRVLCFDHEGGHGGSSRSLFALLLNMRQSGLEIEVWCKNGSHLQDLYAEIGIKVEIHPELPSYAVFSPSIVDNLSLLKSKIPEFIRFSKHGTNISKEISDRFDRLHFNHISFAPLAWYLRKKTGLPATMHIRTIPYYSIMAKWQAWLANQATDDLIYITENEKKYTEHLLGSCNGKIVHNVPFPVSSPVVKHTEISDDSRLKIASLSNFHYIRGVDRIVEVAREIEKSGRSGEILFVMAGTMKLIKSLPGELGEIGRKGGTLEDYVESQGLSNMFKFLGHVEIPESVIESCQMTIKLTRESNPWGRDIIESMNAGRPVITLGSWEGFVKHNENGIMLQKYDAASIASKILELNENREMLKVMSDKSKEHISETCDSAISAQKVIELWRNSNSSIY